MRLIRINHIRCNEHSAVTYVMAPKEWDTEATSKAVSRARENYLEALQAARVNQSPPNDYRPYGSPPYDKYPDRTVAEVKAEWEAKKIEYQAWQEQERETKLSFADFLYREGFVSLYNYTSDEDLDYDIDWGHRHGTPIDYGETRTDTMLTPFKLASEERGEEIDDDDEW